MLVAMRRFADEVSRRRVKRVLVGYGVAMFGGLQGLDVIATRLELPAPWMRWTVLVALAGLPCAAVLAWVFDWTSAGVVRTAPQPEHVQAHPAAGAQRAVTWLALLALLAVAAFLAVRDHRYRNARAQLDEAVRLADEGNLKGSLALAFEVDKVIRSSRVLDRLWSDVARELDVDSTPPGALVEARPFDAPDAPWRTLGVTPLAGARISVLPTQLRVSKPGYVTADRWNWRYGPAHVKLAVSLFRDGEVPAEMVAVPGGDMDFLPLVGLENVAPGAIPEAFVDRYETTNRDYRKFVEAGGYRKRDYWKEPFLDGDRTLSWEEAMRGFVDRTGRPGPATWESGDLPEGQEELPVTGVSWYEAAAYASWAGKSLPTIYHWAQAATMEATPEVVPRSNFGGKGLLRVGASGAVSGFGLFDMAGNAKEWCWNSAGSRRYLLGGAYNEPIYMFNDADAQPPLSREATFGVRLARYPKPVRPELLAPLEPHARDYATELPVSDEAFRIYAGLFGYDKGPLDARVDSVSDSDRFRQQRVSFNAAYGKERVAALVFTPKNVEPPWQVVVIFPGSGSLHARSSADLSGVALFGYLIKSGRAVILPIYKSTYERGDGLTSDNQENTRLYRDHVLMWEQDLARTLDWVESQKELDSKRIAYHGVSWGGVLGPLIAAIEPRLRAVVLISGGLEFQPTLPEVDPFNFAPRAKQPTLMLNGRYDFFFPVETSQQPLFAILGTPALDKRHVIAEGGHAPPQDLVVKETLNWLDRYLGPVR